MMSLNHAVVFFRETEGILQTSIFLGQNTGHISPAVILGCLCHVEPLSDMWRISH
jgi:hypothetical protein